MKQRVETLSQLQWGCELLDLEGDYFIARFYLHEDYRPVLGNGPWIIMGHYLTISKWRPFFCPDEDQILSTLVWVRFPALPVECFKENLLMAVSNTIGKAVKVDLATQDATRGKYARACVEVNLAQPLLPSVTLYGRQQLVEYEGLHLICFHCGRYGHRAEGCPHIPAATVDPNRDTPSEPAPSTESIYGPWMLPRRGRRPRQHKAPGVSPPPVAGNFMKPVDPSSSTRPGSSTVLNQPAPAPPPKSSRSCVPSIYIRRPSR